MPAPKLRAEGLGKSYGQARILEDISFSVMPGEFLTLLGSSGCGKTTLLRILMGLTPPDTGQIFLDGRDITANPPGERNMGIVFQNHALFETMTAEKNVAYALRFHGISRQKAKEAALDMLRRVGLSGQENKRPSQLSLGQQQRVAIARTLVLSPEVLLMDEPLSSLDADNRLILQKEIKELQREFHTTILYVTHDQEEAFALSDRILVLKDGRKEQLSSPEELLKAPATPYVARFVGDNLRQRGEALSRMMGQNEKSIL